MRTSSEIKAYFTEHGADLCGIASVDRFADAPSGFHPRDVLPGAQSVIVVARRFPAGTLRCGSTVPYTLARNLLSDWLDQLTLQFCCDLEKTGAVAVPTDAVGPTERDPADGRMRNILSAKHAAQAAGLGVIGRNTLLITPQFGNMVWLSAILCELPLAPDPLLANRYCEGCSLCVDVCPVQALGEPAMRQAVCLDYAFGGENGGEWKIRCYRCRDVCPYCLGEVNRGMMRPSVQAAAD
ncbi:MAG: epoxyqueuosine reductase [Clostridiales bacterium]|nr:epoxyqueuosine reductase [Clostridiales bacterium]